MSVFCTSVPSNTVATLMCSPSLISFFCKQVRDIDNHTQAFADGSANVFMQCMLHCSVASCVLKKTDGWCSETSVAKALTVKTPHKCLEIERSRLGAAHCQMGSASRHKCEPE